MAWESIQYVTGPLTLAAFVILVVFGILWQVFRHKENVEGFYNLLGGQLKKGELFKLISRLMLFLFAFSIIVFITALIAWRWGGEDPLRTVSVTLVRNGEIVPIDFVLSYTLPDQGLQTITGQTGTGRIPSVPKNVKAIKVAELAAIGYQLTKSGNIEVHHDEISISVEPDLIAPTLNLPDVDPSYLPAPDEMIEDVLDPKSILFHIENKTGRSLALRLCRCDKLRALYSDNAPPLSALGLWIEINDLDHPFDGFSGGDGWYVVFVIDDEGLDRCLGTVNLFVDDDPYLLVEKSGGNYVGKFERVKKSKNSCP